MPNQNKLSPFTLEIIKDSFIAIGEEMFTTVARTSMSPVIYETLDYATGLTDAEGDLLTQGNGITGFVGMLSSMVKEVLRKFEGRIHPGDIFIINDPYQGGGSHLSDVGLVLPVYFEGEIIAFSANKAHWTEVGGKDPGSFTNDSTDIFQEGLQFSCIKLFAQGEINEGILDMIASNVRTPEQSLGDMWAQIAGLRIGEKRFVELCERYSKDAVLQAIEYQFNHGEQIALQALTELTKGDYYAEDFVDTDGIGNGPFPIKVKVTITDEQFICDFRGSSPQVPGPVNASYSGLVAAVRSIFISITNPGQDVNDGIFRPLEIIVDPKSIMSAEKPAPVSNYFETFLGSLNLIWKACAPIAPHRLTAGHYNSVCSVVMAGRNPENNAPFLLVEPTQGGWGASADKDGNSAQFSFGNGETFNVPVEVAETRYGILVDEFSLNTDDGGAGAGEFVGGKGIVRSYQALTDGQTVTGTFGRHKFKPWGTEEGQDGSSNNFYIDKADGTTDGPFGMYARYPLNVGDSVRFVTGTGGGYGDPLMRDPEKVARDVKNELYTVEAARELFGVVVDPDTLDYQITTARKGESNEEI